MMRKLFLIILFFGVEVLLAQSKSDWYIIKDDNEQILYLDTNSINASGELLSVAAMVQYREPRILNTVEDAVKKIKTNLLFYLQENRYTVIGVIYYNVKGKIIGDNSVENYSNPNADYVKLKVEENTNESFIKAKAMQFANLNRITVTKSEYLSEIIDSNAIPDVSELPNMSDENPFSENKEVASDPPPIPQITTPTITEEVKAPEPDDTYSNPEYDNSGEKSMKGMIFTDGKLYCYQVGSVKNRQSAEKEVEKLKNAGFKAFITEVLLPNKGTWHRIRIGYFDTLDETESDYNRYKSKF